MPFYSLKYVFDLIKQDLLARFADEEANALRSIIFDNVLRISQYRAYTEPAMEVSKADYERVVLVVNRLLNDEPIQYILAETEFFGLPFRVDSRVLIPRPETEELVSWIVADHGNAEGLNVADIGTGSGCIAIALAGRLKRANVCAVDVSHDALDVARQNALLNKVNISWLCLDILSNAPFPSGYAFDVMVSNPPYVRNSERAQMQPNVLNNEPGLALFVPDSDPMLFYTAIAKRARKMLKPNGSLYFEINEAFGTATRLMLQNFGFVDVEVRKDIFGKDRMVKCSR